MSPWKLAISFSFSPSPALSHTHSLSLSLSLSQCCLLLLDCNRATRIGETKTNFEAVASITSHPVLGSLVFWVCEVINEADRSERTNERYHRLTKWTELVYRSRTQWERDPKKVIRRHDELEMPRKGKNWTELNPNDRRFLLLLLKIAARGLHNHHHQFTFNKKFLF